MVDIVWTPLAFEDLESIFRYISKDSIFYASKQVDSLIGRVDILKEFPLSGRMVPEFNNEFIRELAEVVTGLYIKWIRIQFRLSGYIIPQKI